MAFTITEEEFNNCVIGAGYKKPPQRIYELFKECSLDGGFENKKEIFMAVVQMAHESMGFRKTEELACSGKNWEPVCDSYEARYLKDVSKGEEVPSKNCNQNKKFYGRGFIQLTHCKNYRDAGTYFELNLHDAPEKVAKNDRIAMVTSMWFWKTNVHQYARYGFGATTRAINGYHDCDQNPHIGEARKRKYNSGVRKAGYDKYIDESKSCLTWSEIEEMMKNNS